MFFSVPVQEDKTETDGSLYTVYEIHVNGAVHSSARYSQLYKLNEQLQKRFDTTNLAEFPPKKLFSLSAFEKEERKALLELYLQTIGQQPEILKSNLFVDFLLQSQKDFNKLYDCDAVKLDVYQADRKITSVDINSSDYSLDVLHQTAASIGIDVKYHQYFALYLMKKNDQKMMKIIRKLQDVECPYLALKSMDDLHSIEIRKTYWNTKIDEELMKHNVTLQMLFIECIRNLEDRWIKPSADTLKTLKQLKTAGLKEKFIRIVKSEYMYGYIQLASGNINYPDENKLVDVLVYAGSDKLRLEYGDGKTISLPIKRIKSWTLFVDKKDTLSINYLVMKDVLKWVNISTSKSNVILISMALQSILDELILLSDGLNSESPSFKATNELLQMSGKNKKSRQDQNTRAPSFNALQNQNNELFMEGINDDDL